MKEKKKKDQNAQVDQSIDQTACDACDEYKNGWKRALADYENLKNDLAKQKEETRRSIKVAFVQDLLPVIDNFAQAVHHVPKELPKECETWLQGVTFIQKQLADVIAGMGVEKIAVNDALDPNLHESVGEGEELKEVQAGWKIGEHVIRPAQVIVKKET